MAPWCIAVTHSQAQGKGGKLEGPQGRIRMARDCMSQTTLADPTVTIDLFLEVTWLGDMVRPTLPT